MVNRSSPARTQHRASMDGKGPDGQQIKPGQLLLAAKMAVQGRDTRIFRIFQKIRCY